MLVAASVIVMNMEMAEIGDPAFQPIHQGYLGIGVHVADIQDNLIFVGAIIDRPFYLDFL